MIVFHLIYHTHYYRNFFQKQVVRNSGGTWGGPLKISTLTLIISQTDQ